MSEAIKELLDIILVHDIGAEYMELYNSATAARVELAARDAEIVRLRYALQAVEYVYYPYVSDVIKRCPSCGTPEGGSHDWDRDCVVARALLAPAAGGE